VNVSAVTDDLGMDRAVKRSTILRGLRVIAMGARQEPLVFSAAVLGSALYGVGTAGSGWLLGRLTDRILEPAFEAGQISGHDLLVVGGSMAGVATATAIGVVARRVAAGITMYRLQARYRRDVTRQFLRLPLAWHHRHPAGQLLSNANADVEAIWQVMAPLPMALGVIVMLIVAVAATFLADPLLAVIGLLVLPGVMLANTLYQRQMSPAVMNAQRLRAEVSAVAHESFEAAAVVKSLGREAHETSRFARSADALREANVRAGQLRAVFDPVIEGIPTLGILLVLLIGTWRVSTGAADTGDVIQVAYLLGLVAFPLRSMGWVLGELPRTVVGWERVSAVLSATGEMHYGTSHLDGIKPVALTVRDASYAHPEPGGEPVHVLHDVTLDIPAGRTVAIVGPTGAGKSTLATLMVRLVDPASGRIEADGIDIRTLRAGGMPEFAAYAGQETFIFDDTIRGNITLADAEGEDDDADDDEVWAALDRARAGRFVAALPQGLDTHVGERGTTLSGGQRQRIALGRALLRHPRFLLLDDAMSAIDPRVEAEILRGLRDSRSGDHAPTVVVIAYRRATIDLADEVVYIERGRVTDRGTHAELLARSAGYRELVTAYDDAAERRNAAMLEGEPA
jgi:ABC-type multidrug transport system fused ATPase/permease subunit